MLVWRATHTGALYIRSLIVMCCLLDAIRVEQIGGLVGGVGGTVGWAGWHA